MTYFDATLEAAPVSEQQNTPIIPEDRFIFELVGFERSQPDQWRKEGGIKWTFRVYDTDGRPFEFQDEHYEFFRTTGLTRDGKPNFNLGTYANDWASALLGRDLGVDANFAVSELRNKRMSAMVVWENQKSDPKKKTIKLASLRHVPVGGPSNGAAKPAPGQVSADPTMEEIDRAGLVADLQKSVKSLKKFDAEAGAAAAKAVAESDLDDAPLDDLRSLLASVQEAISKALD